VHLLHGGLASPTFQRYYTDRSVLCKVLSVAGFVASIPFLLIPLLLASGRVGALVAGLAGLLAAVLALQILPPGSVTGFELLAREVPVGLWLSMQAVAFIVAIAPKIGCIAETLRLWVRQAEQDSGSRDGVTSGERERIKELEREVRQLRQANEILRKASAYFAQAELDRPFKP
jgi:transposase